MNLRNEERVKHQRLSGQMQTTLAVVRLGMQFSQSSTDNKIKFNGNKIEIGHYDPVELHN